MHTQKTRTTHLHPEEQQPQPWPSRPAQLQTCTQQSNIALDALSALQQQQQQQPKIFSAARAGALIDAFIQISKTAAFSVYICSGVVVGGGGGGAGCGSELLIRPREAKREPEQSYIEPRAALNLFFRAMKLSSFEVKHGAKKVAEGGQEGGKSLAAGRAD